MIIPGRAPGGQAILAVPAVFEGGEQKANR